MRREEKEAQLREMEGELAERELERFEARRRVGRG